MNAEARSCVSTHLFVRSLGHTHHEKKDPRETQSFNEVNDGQDNNRGDGRSPTKESQDLLGRDGLELVQALRVEEAVQEREEGQPDGDRVAQHLIAHSLLVRVDLGMNSQCLSLLHS